MHDGFAWNFLFPKEHSNGIVENDTEVFWGVYFITITYEWHEALSEGREDIEKFKETVLDSRIGNRDIA